MSRFWLKWSVYMPMPAQVRSVAAKEPNGKRQPIMWRRTQSGAAAAPQSRVAECCGADTSLPSLVERVEKPTDNRPARLLCSLRLTLILWAIGPSLAPAHPPYPSRAGANAIATEVRSPVRKVSHAGPDTPKHPVPRRDIVQTD